MLLSAMPAGRHNRLRGRQPQVVATIAGVCGVLVGFAGLAPTGLGVDDVALVGGGGLGGSVEA